MKLKRFLSPIRKQNGIGCRKIFYVEKVIIAYNTLGIGRLIYQLPVNLCQIFIDENLLVTVHRMILMMKY